MDKLGSKIRDELATAYNSVVSDYVKTDQQWFIDTDRPIEQVVNDVVSIIIGDY